MRVTNEQAKKATRLDPKEYDTTARETLMIIQDYALDLLEARAIINEFIKVGNEVIAWNVSYRPLIELLEKSKEYAE